MGTGYSVLLKNALLIFVALCANAFALFVIFTSHESYHWFFIALVMLIANLLALVYVYKFYQYIRFSDGEICIWSFHGSQNIPFKSMKMVKFDNEELHDYFFTIEMRLQSIKIFTDTSSIILYKRNLSNVASICRFLDSKINGRDEREFILDRQGKIDLQSAKVYNKWGIITFPFIFMISLPWLPVILHIFYINGGLEALSFIRTVYLPVVLISFMFNIFNMNFIIMDNNYLEIKNVITRSSRVIRKDDIESIDAGLRGRINIRVLKIHFKDYSTKTFRVNSVGSKNFDEILKILK
jgi:hypothetical protein